MSDPTSLTNLNQNTASCVANRDE